MCDVIHFTFFSGWNQQKTLSRFRRQSSCVRRECNQQITGRNLEYDRTLQIIQEEEYLEEFDFDIIRRVKRQIESLEPFLDDYVDYDFEDYENSRHKRQLISYPDDPCYTSTCVAKPGVPNPTGTCPSGGCTGTCSHRYNYALCAPNDIIVTAEEAVEDMEPEDMGPDLAAVGTIAVAAAAAMPPLPMTVPAGAPPGKFKYFLFSLHVVG